MRFTLTGLFRTTLLLGLVSGAVAVARARFEPVPTGFREAVPPRYGVINDYVLDSHKITDPRFIDVQTGAVGLLPLSEGDRLDNVSCSPWRDEEGNYQLIGRWTKRHARPDTQLLCDAFGLARFEMPSGRMIERIPTRVVPTSLPTWAPGTEARVVFASGDGKLYTIDFDHNRLHNRSSEESPADGEVPRVTEIVWRASAPTGPKIFRDPCWPSDPRFKGRMIVSLQLALGASRQGSAPAQLWWTELSPDGRSIVDAGPLTVPLDAGATAAASATDERFPGVANLPGVGLTIAYLRRDGHRQNWHLMVAPVSFDSQRDSLPVVRPETAQIITRQHLPAQPAFAADGRSIFAVLESGNSGEIHRIPLPGNG
jgi:hypothetical protein